MVTFEEAKKSAVLKKQYLEQNIGVCKSAAKYFNKFDRNKDEDELVNIGYIGMDRAFQSYNPELGTFQTYSMWYVKKEIFQEFRQNLLGVPPGTVDLYYRINKALRNGMNKDEVLEKFELTEKKYNRILKQMKPIASLNFKINPQGDEVDVECNSAGPVKEIMDKECLDVIKKNMWKLKDKERKCMMMRYDQERTLESISKEMYLTIEGVRQIIFRAVDKLQRMCDK
jgi:RNA polymerase sigma factor (sigma-70 family)